MTTPGRILIVDDEWVIRETLQAQLAVAGHEVVMADSGAAGLASAAAQPPDLVLLDVMMPEMDGFTVCERLKADPRLRPIPVIMLTALGGKEHLTRGLDAGADEFLTKPVLGLELRARVRSMLRIKRQYDDLQTLMQAREDLVHMVVHDMRSPLTGIKAICTLLEEETPSENSLRQDVRDIAEATEKLHQFIDQMLIMAKLEEVRMPLDRQPVDFVPLVLEVLRAHAQPMRDRRLRLSTELPPAPLVAAIDARLIARVLDNLLSNAIKFSPKGGTITVQLARVQDGEARHVRLQVSDEGPGIPPDYRDVLFEKWRAAELRKAGVAQNGLGLAFCRMVAEAHEGTMSYAPRAGGGSIFTLEIGAGTSESSTG